MYRDKILLRQRGTLKQVILLDALSFLARYGRVSSKNLPSNVTIGSSQPRRQRKRKMQQVAGILGNVFNLGKNLISSGALTKGLNTGSRANNSEIGKKIIDQGIKHVPELYKLDT